MFSFASKMLNTLIGEGQQEGQQPPEGGQMHQPIFRPQTRPPLRAQGPGGMPPHGMGGPQLMGPQRMPGPGIGPGPGPRMQGPRMEFRPRLGMARPQIGPSHMMQRPPPPVASGDDLAVDLSHLSEEERALIQNVMAKAKEIEEPPPSHMDLPGANHGMQMEGRNLGPGMDNRNLGPGMDGRSLGSTMDGRGLGPAMDGRNLGSNMDGRNLGSNMDGRNLGSNMDGRNIGSNMDGRNLGSNMDGRNLGSSLDGRNLGSTLDGRNLSSTMDHRILGSSLDSRGLGTSMDGRSLGSIMDGQQRQDLSMARPMHSSFQPHDNRQDSFKVCQDSFSSNLQKDNFMHGGQQRQDCFSSSSNSESFFGNNTWENPTAAQDKEPQSRSDACEYSTAGAGPPVNGSSFNPDVRLSPGSPYSTSPASDDESSREKSILSEIKNLNESSLISNQTESEELDKNKVNTGPSLVGQGILLEPFYDHSPGEVYTIPEEEDEISSPTSGDGVTSLRKRRLVGGKPTTIASYSKKKKKRKERRTNKI
ncbi:uncharacterized protein LOC124369228 [Homalodisca vitripennis]|uniref:uncharacterized protein LOC124369228 n=1 Tax=Homalodisca vitripennis TaxID=197043 RepID=UPI001EE9CE1E|nr:uncharacterized protein LOC124369228 [Homalodisca vitripennis]